MSQCENENALVKAHGWRKWRSWMAYQRNGINLMKIMKA
jgi:hypothetical protein